MKIRKLYYYIYIIVIVIWILAPFQNAKLFVSPILEGREGTRITLSWSDDSDLNGSVASDIGEESIRLPLTPDVTKATKNYKINISPLTSDERIILKEMTIYRNGLNVKTISGEDLISYVLQTEDIVEMTPLGMTLGTYTDKCEFLLNETFSQLLYELSSTVLEERLIVCAAFTIIYWFIITILSILEKKHGKSRIILVKDENEAQERVIRGVKVRQNDCQRFFADIRKYAYFIFYSAKTDLKAEVANSYLNWIWWVLEPLCSMLVYTFVFGNLMKNSTEYYSVFVYSSLLMWNFFNHVVLYSVKAVRSNRDIVTKVYMPKYVLVLSNMLLNGFKLLISLVILAALMLVMHVKVTTTILYILPVYLVMFLVTFGISTIFMHFGVFVDDLSYAVSIAMQMLFFLSGIFYEISGFIPVGGELLMAINPIAFLVDTMRGALLYGRTPDFLILGIWAVLGLLASVWGIHLVYKYENSYVKIV